MTNQKQSKRILSVTIRQMFDESPDTSWLGEYANRPTSDEFSIDRAHSLDCIENDYRQKTKLQRIAEAIESGCPPCEDHLNFYDETCQTCREEQAYSDAMHEIRHLAECDCDERGDMERHQYRYFNPSSNYVDKNGHALPDHSYDEVKKYVLQDYKRMETLNRGDWCFIGLAAEAEIVTQARQGNPIQKIHSGGLWGIESDSDDSHIEETEKEELSELKNQLLALGFSKRAISTAFKNVEHKERE